ncbi:hypothetical protein LFZ25_19935 [Salmonella enterica subsp. enterica serovar Macclesfield str. S-1643]|uniref:Uncharacterized protein n=1 Tax=Salmonella enterica subsp. enterica serovar Macclesfield str. S-1643 TaxID=1242107 RepID=A0A2C9P3P4_SALET|nr:hypothetical protein LFZ25_19935 [Salmonella enterica subsp. enterica serovar Macclesfield str. S-1643]EAA5485140.1 hypothetical protein [Salmonella enterica subsp. enterica serovar Kouka]
MNKIITIIFNQIKITNASDHSFKMINKNQKSFCYKKAGILPAGMCGDFVSTTVPNCPSTGIAGQ